MTVKCYLFQTSYLTLSNMLVQGQITNVTTNSDRANRTSDPAVRMCGRVAGRGGVARRRRGARRRGLGRRRARPAPPAALPRAPRPPTLLHVSTDTLTFTFMKTSFLLNVS